jgi:hypothetical protein
MKKFVSLLLIISLFGFPVSISQAQAPSVVRIGLERDFRNVNSISISNTIIQAGGQTLQSAEGFSVRVENDGRVALYGGSQLVLQVGSGESLTLRDGGNGFISLGSSRYRGSVEFGRFGGSGITAVNIVSAEEYLYGVVSAEMGAGFHHEALKAQAVAARSYMLTRMGVHSAQGYDLCDQGHCQAYRGVGGEHEPAVRAVNETMGQVMYHERRTHQRRVLFQQRRRDGKFGKCME